MSKPKIHLRDFNPCCFGSVSATAVKIMQRERHLVFQSLLFWIGLCDRRSRIRALRRRRRFQSLLFWIGLCDGFVDAFLALCLKNFNPCCFGSVSATSPSAGSGSFALAYFNPCCFGSVSATIVQVNHRIAITKISILAVLDRSLRLEADRGGLSG